MAVKVGTSGWSYPSWRPGFYPDGLQPAEFLAFYAQRFDTVELNSTGYRLPSADQFRRWAEAVPDGFEFAVKFSLVRLDRVTTFLERVLALGDRLGPVRVVYEGPRDNGTLSFVQGSVPADVRLAWDLRDESWAGVEDVLRVNDLAAEPFRYVRLREPPYSDDDLHAIAATIHDPAYVYVRHEDEPTAPETAYRLRGL
ncbi:MAG TPA: DUF72 domain-containing protein, partial [Gaiellaceae bacterium]|nr:DUF72 domain-containing protein [Gaiellaceae bacterium]